MIFYKSEGALFRREPDDAWFQIYVPSGKWTYYRDRKDNLFTSASVISTEEAKKLAGDIDSISPSTYEGEGDDLTLQHKGEPGPTDPHKSGSPQTVHGKKGTRGVKTGISGKDQEDREKAQENLPSEVRVVTEKSRAEAMEKSHAFAAKYLEDNNLKGRELKPKELADFVEHLGKNLDDKTMKNLQTRCVLGNCPVTDERYTLNFYEDENVSVYLLRWGPNEEAEWHDHGDGLKGAKVGVFVYGDEFVENDILMPNGKIVRQKLKPGGKYALGAPYIHRVVDWDNHDESWTVHAYSGEQGGLAKMNFYEFDRGGNIVIDENGGAVKTSEWINPAFKDRFK